MDLAGLLKLDDHLREVVLVGLCTTLIAERLLSTGVGLLTAGLFIIGFLSVAAFHNRIKTRLWRYTLWCRLKATHIARLRRDWERGFSPQRRRNLKRC